MRYHFGVRRPAVLLAAAVGLGAARGKVVRVETPPSRVVEVAAGTFTMGMTADDASEAYDLCVALHGQNRSQGTFAGANAPFCEEYDGMLVLMETEEVD